MSEGQLTSELMLTAEQRAAIGTVAVETTYLEFAMERLIRRLLGINEHAHAGVLTERLGITQKLDALHELGRTRLSDEKQRAEWSKYVSKVRDLVDKRNLIIHGIWLLPQASRIYPNPQPSAVRLRAKGIRTFEAGDIQSMAAEIHEAKSALDGFERGYLFADE